MALVKRDWQWWVNRLKGRKCWRACGVFVKSDRVFRSEWQDYSSALFVADFIKSDRDFVPGSIFMEYRDYKEYKKPPLEEHHCDSQS